MPEEPVMNDPNYPVETPNALGHPSAGPEALKGHSNQNNLEGHPVKDPNKADVDYEKRYKDLQPAYTKSQTKLAQIEAQISQLDQYGGPAEMAKWGKYLATNEEVQSLIKKQLNQEKYENSDVESDPALKEAHDIIRKTAREVVKEQLQGYHNQINPTLQNTKDRVLQEAKLDMDKQYPGWRDSEQAMVNIAKVTIQ